MLHIFITNRIGDAAPGATGRPVAGYEARIVDDDMKDVPDGTIGRLAVRGPTGCRYLADKRQKNYVARRLEPYRRFIRAGRGRPLPFRCAQRRHDHLGGLQHRRPRGRGGAVGARRKSRNARWSAQPTPSAARSSPRLSCSRPASTATNLRIKLLQDHVKATIAPYKYPRAGEIRRRPAEDADRQNPAVSDYENRSS